MQRRMVRRRRLPLRVVVCVGEKSLLAAAVELCRRRGQFRRTSACNPAHANRRMQQQHAGIAAIVRARSMSLHCPRLELYILAGRGHAELLHIHQAARGHVQHLHAGSHLNPPPSRLIRPSSRTRRFCLQVNVDQAQRPHHASLHAI